MINARARRGISRRRFIVAAGAVFVPLRRVAASETKLLPSRFDPARDAARDLDTALSIARATRRRVLVEVGGEWCAWCHVMDRFFVSHPELKRIRDANYVWLKINYSKENQNAAFLARWPKVAGYPHLFVLGPDGRLLQSQDTGQLEAGKDYDPIAFRTFLLSWSPR